MRLNSKREYLFRKQRGKEIFPKYTEELDALLDLTKGNFEILGIEESDRILKQSIENINKNKFVKYKIEFEQKEKPLKESLVKCDSRLPGKVYMFTSYSEDCGLVLLDSILMFKYDFKYSAEHAGTISIISENLCNNLLIDFDEESGNFIVEIEMFGDVWGN